MFFALLSKVIPKKRIMTTKQIGKALVPRATIADLGQPWIAEELARSKEKTIQPLKSN